MKLAGRKSALNPGSIFYRPFFFVCIKSYIGTQGEAGIQRGCRQGDPQFRSSKAKKAKRKKVLNNLYFCEKMNGVPT